jgi:hypothetical protein
VLQDSAEAGSGYWYLYRNGADGKLKFYRNGDRAVFDGVGKFGLGTQNPIGQLHIAASTNHLVFQDTAEAGANYWYQYTQGGDGKLHFWKSAIGCCSARRGTSASGPSRRRARGWTSRRRWRRTPSRT